MIWTTWSFSVGFGIAVVAIITFCPGDIQVKATGNELARHGVLMLASNSSWSAPNAGGGGPKIFIHDVVMVVVDRLQAGGLLYVLLANIWAVK